MPPPPLWTPLPTPRGLGSRIPPPHGGGEFSAKPPQGGGVRGLKPFSAPENHLQFRAPVIHFIVSLGGGGGWPRLGRGP